MNKQIKSPNNISNIVGQRLKYETYEIIIKRVETNGFLIYSPQDELLAFVMKHDTREIHWFKTILGQTLRGRILFNQLYEIP